jgi:hypothetical protein
MQCSYCLWSYMILTSRHIFQRCEIPLYGDVAPKVYSNPTRTSIEKQLAEQSRGKVRVKHGKVQPPVATGVWFLYLEDVEETFTCLPCCQGRTENPDWIPCTMWSTTVFIFHGNVHRFLPVSKMNVKIDIGHYKNCKHSRNIVSLTYCMSRAIVGNITTIAQSGFPRRLDRKLTSNNNSKAIVDKSHSDLSESTEEVKYLDWL